MEKKEKKYNNEPIQGFEILSDRDYNERMEGMDTKGNNIDGEEETNLGEEKDKKRTSGKRNITIKMPTNKEEDDEDKTFRCMKRGRDFQSNEKN